MKKEGKYKYLLKNVGLLSLSNFGSKILSFILIPLYTNLLTTEEYGTYDIYSTTISLLIPILTLNIINAVLRYSLDKEKNKKNVFSIGMEMIIISFIFLLIFVIINNIFHIFGVLEKFWIYFIFLYSGEVLYSLLTNFGRGIDKVKQIAIAAIINSVSILLFNIVFLLWFRLGLRGYFIANILGYFIPTLYLIYKLKIWQYISIKQNDKKLKKEMAEYSKPMIFNTIGWWITNVSDRYVVTWICGVAINGIYSVAYKIPSILNIFQTIFNQAWTLSAVKEYDNNSSEFYTNIYKLYNLGLVIMCSILILCDKIIAKILFAKNFYSAWKYAPFLMISVIFGALSGLLEGIFVANKNTKVIAKTTIIGAVINIVFNIILVNIFGAIGAAISTLIAYIIVWSFRLRDTNKILRININYIKNIFSYLLLLLQTIVLLLNYNCEIAYATEIIIFFIIIGIYYKDINGYMGKIKVYIRKRKVNT